MVYHALIMAGGSGTRLWPLSRELQPKQSLRLVGDRSMFQHAVERLNPLFKTSDIWVVTREDHAGLLQDQVPELKHDNFIIEPQGRGTAPAIGLAALHLEYHDPEAVMAVLTADHYIADRERFQAALAAADKIARQNYLVTLGITPSSPSTAFGYIEQGQNLDRVDGFDVCRVRAFIEKPVRETAGRMVSSGIYSWNSGMFIWRASKILQEFQRQMPEFYQQLMQIKDVLGTDEYGPVLARIWPQVTKETIDYGVMEGAADVAVIPVEIGWTDVGSWGSLFGLLPADENENAVEGSHLGIDTARVLVFGNKRLVATIGVKDLVIVDTDDALLICARGHEQQVKEIVDRLKTEGRKDLL